MCFAYCALAGAAFCQTSDTEWGATCSKYASVPLPAEAESVAIPKESPACASYKSYRGIGRPVNFSGARACAWQERAAQKAGLQQNQKEPAAWVVGGSLILADIYYNGAGVKKDVPLAMHFACESEEGMAELASEDLAKPGGPTYAHKPFEFCDYGATTFTMNFCGGYESEIVEDRRNREYERLKSSMSLDQQAAFSKLLAAEGEYIQAHDFEVDQGGTIRVIRTLGSEKILNDLFHSEVVKFERKTWPMPSQERIVGAGSLLDSEYQKAVQRIEAQPKDEIDEGGVTAGGFSKAQTAWKAYRDAWTAFARERDPSKAAAVRAEITFDRYRLVKTIP